VRFLFYFIIERITVRLATLNLAKNKFHVANGINKKEETIGTKQTHIN